MNTTFLLGNGFDVCLGLKTKYQQFYENHYAGLPKEGVPNALKDFLVQGLWLMVILVNESGFKVHGSGLLERWRRDRMEIEVRMK